MRSRAKWLIGETFGYLLVLERDFNPENRGVGREAFWKCKCLKCGKNVNRSIRTRALKDGRTLSCGCLNKEILKSKSKNNSVHWKGFGDLPGLYFYDIKTGAERRKIHFELTEKYLWELFQKQDGRCAYSGLQLNFQTKRKVRNQSASLDRIDSSKGYIEGNVQWVHKDINWMKRSLSEQSFLNYCKLIVNFKKI